MSGTYYPERLTKKSALPIAFLNRDGKIDELPVAGAVVDEVGAQPEG